MHLQPTDSGRLAAFDSIRLVHRTWRAENPIGGVLIAHGFAEHGMRYGHVIDVLVPAGFSVMTFDQRGHGESGGRRGHVDRFGDYGDDLTMMIAFARERLPGPLVLLAHSMGGLIATTVAAAGKLDVDHLVLSNPALAVKVAVPQWKIMAARTASRWLPHVRIPTDIPPEHISRDAQEVRAYIDDPLVFNEATTRWGGEFLAAQDAIADAASSVKTPHIFVQLGSADMIADPVVNVDFFGKTGSSDCRVEVYADCYHELYNEMDSARAPILDDLRDWLVQRAQRVAA